MSSELFPATLNRKQYLLRWLVWFAILILGLWLWVAALIRAEVFLGWVAASWIYDITGLAIPRLKNVGWSPWLAVLLLAPYVNLLMFVVLFVARPKKP